MGIRFWLIVVAVGLAAALGAVIFFMLFGWAWSSFGLLGALVLFGAVVIALAWASDRREQRRRRSLA